MIYTREEDQKHVRWYDYFWLLIPIAGIAVFDMAVSLRRWDWEDKKGRRNLPNKTSASAH